MDFDPVFDLPPFEDVFFDLPLPPLDLDDLDDLPPLDLDDLDDLPPLDLDDLDDLPPFDFEELLDFPFPFLDFPFLDLEDFFDFPFYFLDLPFPFFFPPLTTSISDFFILSINFFAF